MTHDTIQRNAGIGSAKCIDDTGELSILQRFKRSVIRSSNSIPTEKSLQRFCRKTGFTRMPGTFVKRNELSDIAVALDQQVRRNTQTGDVGKRWMSVISSLPQKNFSMVSPPKTPGGKLILWTTIISIGIFSGRSS